MKLYLARHGDYTLNVNGVDILSERGTKDVAHLSERIKSMNLHISCIWHSGKHRAEQTALLLAKGFISDQAPEAHPGLNPDDEVLSLASDLRHFNEDMLIVGHLPFLDKLVSQLLTGSDENILINFQTGTLTCLSQIDHVQWVLDWGLTPNI